MSFNCVYCGAGLPHDAETCPKCGTSDLPSKYSGEPKTEGLSSQPAPDLNRGAHVALAPTKSSAEEAQAPKSEANTVLQSTVAKRANEGAKIGFGIALVLKLLHTAFTLREDSRPLFASLTVFVLACAIAIVFSIASPKKMPSIQQYLPAGAAFFLFKSAPSIPLLLGIFFGASVTAALIGGTLGYLAGGIIAWQDTSNHLKGKENGAIPTGQLILFAVAATICIGSIYTLVIADQNPQAVLRAIQPSAQEKADLAGYCAVQADCVNGLLCENNTCVTPPSKTNSTH
jgi:hypothetical protein